MCCMARREMTRDDIGASWSFRAFRSSTRTSTTGCFAQRFLIVAADMTAELAACWPYPSCVAEELAWLRVELHPDLTRGD